MDTAETKELIPDFLRRPHFLLWFVILPQLLLLLLNYRTWLLVGDDMSPEQIQTATYVVVFELALLGLNTALTAIWFAKRLRVNWMLCIPTILVHAAYLWLFTGWIGKLLPPNVVLWIMPESLLLYHQYAFIMPAIFYAALLLSCTGIKVRRVWDVVGSVLALVGVPAAVYLILIVGFRLFKHSPGDIEEILILVFVVAATTVTMLAFFRVLMYLYTWIGTYRSGRIVLAALAGLAAPLCGLLLNKGIPFPYDFQAPGVYVLTVINGIVLLLPSARDGKYALATWCLRMVMYPFTLYFFMVFLPFLPLSLLAMIAAGAGFLILAPTLLFAIHTRRLIDEWPIVRARLGLTTGLVLLVACVATIPALYTARALLDKRALMNAVDYVYSVDPAANAEPEFPLRPARRALNKLNRMKNGIYVPFLSEYYNRIVFDNMVLPDYKMKRVYTALFGEDLEQGLDRRRGAMTDLFGTRSGARRAMQGGTPPPPRTVRLADVAVSHNTTNGIALAHVALTLCNTDQWNAEFVADIAVPPGVLVSDYWLDVEGTKVPGRVFERKTAMWVYHMIRDATRRDPGLLVYRNPETLRLNVFPFERKQTRTTGFTFMFPQGAAPVVRIAERDVPLALPDAAETPLALRTDAEDTTFVYLNKASLQALPATERTPHLHFLLDVAAGTETTAKGWQERIAAMLPRFPAASTCVISLVNRRIESTLPPCHVTPAAIRETLGTVDWNEVPRTGGFCPERAIKHLLTRDDPDRKLLEVPVFVALAEQDSNVALDGDLAPFERLVPDHPVYYLVRDGGSLKRTQFRTGHVASRKVPDELAPVIPIVNEAGGAVALKNAPGALLALPRHDGAIAVAGADGRQVCDCTTLDGDGRYARGLQLWAQQRHADRNPQLMNELLPRLVHDSRRERILIPATSFIVVESDAQWKMLTQKEKQSLKADHALEFDEHQESPAPPAWLLAPVVLALLWWRERRQKACRT